MSETKLHLFNKVYLELHNYLDYCEMGAVICPQATPDIEVDWKGESLSDALNGKSLKTKFTELFNVDSKYVIYCDVPTFVEIAATWLKSSTSMNTESYETYIDCYLHRRNAIDGSGNEEFKAAFMSAWGAAKKYDFKEATVKYNLEFLLPSVIVNSDHRGRDQLRSAITSFIKRHYEYIFLDAKDYIDLYILDEDVQKLFGGTGKTAIDYLDLPGLEIYKSDWWNTAGTAVPGIKSKLDLDSISKSDLRKLKATTEKAAKAFYSEAINLHNWKFLDVVIDRELNDTELDEFIEYWTHEKNEMSFIPHDLRPSLSFVFLSYLKTLAKTNDIDSIRNYSIK